VRSDRETDGFQRTSPVLDENKITVLDGCGAPEARNRPRVSAIRLRPR
jgi:hypothetical protein